MNFTPLQTELLEAHFNLDRSARNSPSWEKLVKLSSLIGCGTNSISKWWRERKIRAIQEDADRLVNVEKRLLLVPADKKEKGTKRKRENDFDVVELFTQQNLEIE